VTDLAFNDPCILFAMRRESRPFLDEFRPQQRFPGAPCRARFCGPAWLTVLVLETGIGRAAAKSAVDWVLSKPLLGNVPYEPRLVMAAGFAGALQEDRRVGDVVLATELADERGKSWRATWPEKLPDGEWRPPLHRGRVLTADRLVGDPQTKRHLGQQFEALAVDMESAIVAEECSCHGVPFGCVRAISEDAGTSLSPKLVSLLSGGRIAPLRVAGVLLRSPALVPELMRLRKQTHLAANQLAKALGELLTLTLPFGAEL
jgi:adenosylhomocysteine nucleosidase